jgi:hypothetical protein
VLFEAEQKSSLLIEYEFHSRMYNFMNCVLFICRHFTGGRFTLKKVIVKFIREGVHFQQTENNCRFTFFSFLATFFWSYFLLLFLSWWCSYKM